MWLCNNQPTFFPSLTFLFPLPSGNKSFIFTALWNSFPSAELGTAWFKLILLKETFNILICLSLSLNKSRIRRRNRRRTPAAPRSNERPTRRTYLLSSVSSAVSSLLLDVVGNSLSVPSSSAFVFWAFLRTLFEHFFSWTVCQETCRSQTRPT